MKIDVNKIKGNWFRKPKTVVNITLHNQSELNNVVGALLWLEENKHLVDNLPNTDNNGINDKKKICPAH